MKGEKEGEEIKTGSQREKEVEQETGLSRKQGHLREDWGRGPGWTLTHSLDS